MIAKIRSYNSFYNSIVFAIFNNGWKSKVLVFNQDYTALQTVPMYSLKRGSIEKRNVFIYNTEKDNDWIDNKNVVGYGWVFEVLTCKFSVKKTYDTAIFDKCKALQTTVQDREWMELKNDADVEALLYAALDFHDAYVKSIFNESEKQYICFDTTWDCEILFELEGNFETNLFKDYGHIVVGENYPTIYAATMFFQNNMIYWVDDDGVTSVSEIDKSELFYFCANCAKWKLIVH